MGGADRSCEQRDGGLTVDGKLMKTRNRAAAVVCGVLCLAVWLVWSGAYRQIRGGEEEKLTVGVFSDSYWDVQNGYSYKIVDDAIQIFEERHPDIKVEYVSGILKDDYSEWLAEQLLSEKGPDVFFILGDDFSSFADAGALKDLSALIEEDEAFDQSRFYSSAFSSGNYDDGQYALPFECAPKLMFVNRTILDSEGIDMPENGWTWEEFYEICRSVTKDTDGDGLIDQFGAVGYTWVEAFESNGVKLFDQNGTECCLTAPGVEAALSFVERMAALNAGYNVSERDFDLGNAAFQPMLFSEFRAYQSYPLSVKKYSGFDWGCIPMPAGPEGDNISSLDTLLVGMNDATSETKYAWEFMKILTYDTEIQPEIFDYSEGVSVLRDVTESEQTLERLMEDSGSEESLNLSILSEAVENSLVEVKFPGYEEAQARVDQAVSQIIEGDGNISMEQIIWNREINRYLEERRSSGYPDM